MADAKITALAENTTPAGTDIAPMVDDPAGTPVTQKVTITNLLATGAVANSVLAGTASGVASYSLAPRLANIADTGGTNRITLATSSIFVVITGSTSITDNNNNTILTLSATVTPAATWSGLVMSPSITPSVGITATGLLMQPTVVFPGSATTTAVRGLAFKANPVFTNASAVVTEMSAVWVTGRGAVTQTGCSITAFHWFNAAPFEYTTSTQAVTITSAYGLRVQSTPNNNNWNFTTLYGILVESSASTKITNWLGIDIQQMTGASTINLGIRNASPTAFTQSTAQTLAAATATLANATVVGINSSGNVTITAAPSIADGQDGQILIIVNVDSADTITYQDQGTLASSNLRLSAATIALAPRDNLMLMYSAAVGDWIQIGTTNVI